MSPSTRKPRRSSVKRWVDFYGDHLGDDSEAFLRTAGVGDGTARGATKSILLSACRMVELADLLKPIRPQTGAIPLLFLVAVAEAVSKLESGETDDGNTGRHVRRFFKQLVPEQQQTELAHAFVRDDDRPFSLNDAINYLYRVRCRLAHAEEYWDFRFASGQGAVTCRDGEAALTCRLTYQAFRTMVIAGAAYAAMRTLAREAPVKR